MPRYMLTFVSQDDWWEKQSEEDLKKAYAPIMSWWDELVKTGVVRSGEQLAPQRTATTVKRVNGAMKVTDGPFIESKESVGGYAIIDVADLDKAIAVAKSWPGGDVEVRPVVEH
ncbi:MAG TPA: YciI family protein [Candidatus Limnocylindria bacterium]|jgi:hypothetical protein|nr:YciI family protein [Candidatus Limnocylindria bacterium]